MSLRRLTPILVLALLAAVAVVSHATAGNIADEPCPNAAGANTNTCPPGAVGAPYSVKFREAEGSGCGPGQQSFEIGSGAPPPGLTLASDGTLAGTPTQAGTFSFYVVMREPLPPTGSCKGEVSDKQFTIRIAEKLTIGPETAPSGTVNAPYSLAMTASLSDPKTWSIVQGALPPGLTLGASDGVISGTPTTAGSYTFTVSAVVDAQRSGTKALAIVVRDPLAITGASVPRSEVGVSVRIPLAARGGSETYSWSLAAGALPPGVALAANGTISGRPSAAGAYRFTVSVADTEGRTASYNGALTVAPRLAISTRLLRPAKVGRPYRQRVATTGGVLPRLKVKQGSLPKGLRFDSARGVLNGTPLEAGTRRVVFEAVDSLGVKVTRTLVIRVLR